MSEWKKWTDKTPVSDEAIIDHFQRLIHYISCVMSRSYKLQEEDRQDIVSAAQLALLRLPQDKRPLEGYCKTTITHAMRSALISVMGRGGTPTNKWSEYATFSVADAAPSRDPYAEEEDTNALDRISPTVSPEAGWVTAITVDNALGCLTDREREIVRLYYFHDLTMKKIGERYGVSHASVSDTLKCAINKLRKSFRKTR